MLDLRNKNLKTTSQFIRKTISKSFLLFLLAAVTFLSACSFLPLPGRNRPTYTLPETGAYTTTQTTVAETEKITAVTTQPTLSESSATTSDTGRELDEEFDRLIRQLITEGLEMGQREIALDPLFTQYAVSKERTDEVVERIYREYRHVYARNPQYFYLSGAVRLNYHVGTGDDAFLQKATLLPQYWPAMESKDDRELAETKVQIEQIATDLAAQIRQQTAVPWQQLQLLHNWLVREIEYDTEGSQDLNNTAGALLDRKTLCQGYAQAFQMTGQLMGFDIILITGESAGIGHAWNLVFLEGHWYHVDATHDDPVPDGGRNRPPQHIHFLRSDAVMAQTHIWEKTDYPAVESDGAHYYHINGLTVADRVDLVNKLVQRLRNEKLDTGEKILFEWLYIGNDIPSRSELDDLLAEALERAEVYLQIFYRAYSGKSVILFEISTGND